MSAPVTMRPALQIIRTWAAFERDHPGIDTLVPEHVLKLCDEALGIVPEAGLVGRAYRAADAILARAISMYSSDSSMPTNRNPSSIAALPVLPLPMNGSSTSPPGGVTRRHR